ncbi:GDSL-type esterase/lipase family protein [Caldibacillus thermoamylovorans]|uniref:GDSL-type esterase/lipase family protein n=1 Tax=Caldibacillus thermoamylovorans TaxID=35841 RepID=UPI0022E739E2|nr:GDSL-type esterase/lipase family protein [Caldibacillus thermoamylovorans]
MKKRVKQFITTILSVLLVISFVLPHQTLAANFEKPILNYVALGDSLAAGYLNDKSRGRGYPEFIKERIESGSSYLVDLQNFGIGGYRTTHVLDDLINPQSPKYQQVREAIKQADIITYDAGANDVLGVIGDVTKFNPNDSELMKQIQAAMITVGDNIDVTLKEIRKINPDAQVYIMGYYNALHFLPNIQDAVLYLIGKLNKVIDTVAFYNGATFVPTFEIFNGKYQEYLPNPDIHPTEAGYQAIAGQFANFIIPNLPIVWIFGEGTPSDEKGHPRDKYLDIKNWVVYEKVDLVWQKSYDLKEYEGEQLVGQGSPKVDYGKVGDFYFDQNTNILYVKVDELFWLEIGKSDPIDDNDGGQNGEQPGDSGTGSGGDQTGPQNNEKDGSQNTGSNQGENLNSGNSGTTGEKLEQMNNKANTTNTVKTAGNNQRLKLPNTATNNGLFLLIGMFTITIAGVSYLMYFRRIKREGFE